MSRFTSTLFKASLLLLLQEAICQELYNITFLNRPEPVPSSYDVGKTLQPTQPWDFNVPYHNFEAGDLGNLLAGRQEFPWVVDIRGEDLDQEFWAIGNIVSYNHVLTTCRFLFFHLRHVTSKQWAAKYFNQGLVSVPPNTWVDSKKVSNPLKAFSTQIEVHYATTYLWDFKKPLTAPHGLLSNLFARDFNDSGTRLAKNLIMHPECGIENNTKDVGIIELTNSIPLTKLPRSYMPIIQLGKNRIQFLKMDDLENQVKDNLLCYVASFGRNYYNIKDHSVVDYKVKYRVYKMEMSECSAHWSRYQCGPTDGLCSIGKNEKAVVRDYTMCFNSRALVGAVCQHDNGAPLVCNGRVYGIVIRGASFQYCHDLIPIPFLVLNVYSFSDYFNAYTSSLETFERVAHEYYNKKIITPLAGAKSRQPFSARPSYILAIFIVLIIFEANRREFE